MKRPVVMLLLASALTLSLGLQTVAPVTSGGMNVVWAAENESDNESDNHAKNEQKDKTETVYVDANADGSVKKITVKDWLRRNGDGEIQDFSNLKDIKNTEGDEEYTQAADGTVVWENKGEDISYEGTSERQLPVETKVTYYLDGQEIKPEALAGKSGKVKIRFDYTNQESRVVNVDGQELEVKVPFLAAPVLVLSGDKFKNVQVSSGKVMSDQEQNIVIGTSFPGLRESLGDNLVKKDDQKEGAQDEGGLDEDDLKDIGLDEDDLKDIGLDEDDLKDIGLEDYVEVTADVTDFELDFTATAITTCGLSDMKNDNLDDLKEMIDGVQKMNEASDGLVDAMKQFGTGAGTLEQYLNQYTAGVSQADSGAQTLAAGLKELENQVNVLMKNVSEAGADNADSTDSASAQTAAKIQQDLQILQNSLGSVATLSQYTTTISQNIENARTSLQNANTEDIEKEASRQAQEKAEQAVSDATKETDASTKANVIANIQKTEAYNTLTDEQKDEIAKAVQDAKGNADQTQTDCKNITISLSNASSAKASIEQAAKALETAQNLTIDTNQAQTALTDLVQQFETLSEKLTGISDMTQIGEKLQNAISQLASGAATLGKGTSQLNIAGSQLNNGMQTLTQGAALLETGMQTFDEEGIDKLDKLAGKNQEDLLNHIKAIKEAEKTYTNYGGIQEGASGSVKFIVETEKIK